MPELPGHVADGFAGRVRSVERAALSEHAVQSYETRGRAVDEAECRLRTPFQRDRDRIVHCKAFRRLKHKTQVFVDPPDHFRTRLTHTIEAAGIARTVARALRLNEDLTEAIALGHDLGHPPFGHTGEEALDAVLRERFGRSFRHNEQSLRVVEALERDGRGLNLTWEVRDGILNHTGDGEPATLEGRIVRLVDRVAYLNHDIDDATRAGVLDPTDLPAAVVAVLGSTSSERIDRLVHDIVETSAGTRDIRQSEDVGGAMLDLRAWMFEHVYLGPVADVERARATASVTRIFEHLLEHPEELPEERPGDEVQRITDYVAGMTDRFALAWP
ncbi:MAG: deoxyguanosinetriphosphate triphosphohydrolase [Thermoleophilia bacterium]